MSLLEDNLLAGFSKDEIPEWHGNVTEPFPHTMKSSTKYTSAD